jgi:hypothetical protein
LSTREVRKFSFEYAAVLNIKILEGWRDMNLSVLFLKLQTEKQEQTLLERKEVQQSWMTRQ